MMIKRLTDEPTTLAAARPDLSFPTGLQPVLDTALGRTPLERYQTVLKFAADVAAVTGPPVEGAVPHTRSRGDTEGKTQLIDTTGGGPTQRISAQKPAPTKRRSLIPVAIGVVVVLAGGVAWMALSGGGKVNPNATDSVAHNTATNPRSRQTDAVPPVGTQSVTLANRDTGHRSRAPAPPAAPPAAPAASSRFNLAGALAALTELLDSIDSYPNKMVRDSASALYNAPGISASDKAMAAFVIGNTYFQLKDRAQGCSWVRRARSIYPLSSVYSTFVQAQCS